jgi:hypothetical protein
MRPVRPSLQSAADSVVSTLVFAATLLVDAATSATSLLRQSLARVARGLRTVWRRGKGSASELSGPAKRVVAGPLRVFLVGRRASRSLLVTLSSPALAIAVAWWVGSTVGYESFAASVRGTWFGTDPSLSVFAAVGALLLLAAASAAANSGILPTTLLVSAPVFGAVLTRYGTTVTYTWGVEVVSLPNAVGTAALLGVMFGVPIAVAGFSLGAVARRAGRSVSSRGDAAESA